MIAIYTVVLSLLGVFAYAETVKPFPISSFPDPYEGAHLPAYSSMVLQSDRLFLPHDAQFQPNAAVLLQALKTFIDQSPQNLMIQITAYSDDIPNQQERKHMTAAQAASIASYLWSQGIELDRIRFHGAGNKNPIASPYAAKTNAQNRRVEVRLYDMQSPTLLYPFKEPTS